MPQVSQTQERRYYPMLFVEEQEGTAFDVLSRMWQRYAVLPREQKDILISDEIVEKIFALQQRFSLSDVAIGKVTMMIRKLFLGDIDLASLETRLAEGLLVVGINERSQIQGITEYIQKEILTIKPQPKVEEGEEVEEKPQVATIKMPLLQALSQYEQLGNQLITLERIKIKSQSEPVRPSLLYWIKYYRDELGIGHHDSVQRGNFLFRSENGKRLSAEERERVNLVLKSVEENFPLEIDIERSEIIFPVFTAPTPRPAPVAREMAPSVNMAEKMVPRPNPAFSFGGSSMAAPAPVAAPVSQGGEMSFSSKHVFPAEKTSQTAQAPQAVPASTPRMNQPTTMNAPTGTQTIPRANPFRIRPVSLGKEE